MMLATHLHLRPRLGMSGVTPVLPLYAFMASTENYNFLPFSYSFLSHISKTGFTSCITRTAQESDATVRVGPLWDVTPCSLV
jgi:hypothetical protein